MDNIKNLFKNKKIIIMVIAIVLLIIAVSGILVYIDNHVLTKLERIKITEFSDKVVDYMDEVELSKDDKGKYINFAIEYLYNTTDKKEFNLKEVLEVINDTYDVSYTDEDIQKIGISEGMLNKGIVYDGAKKSFTYNISKTRTDIANTPIIKYELKKIKKVNKNKFEVTYDKYLVENPYEILNYFDKYNIEKNDDEEKMDTKEILSYLKGETKVGVIKEIINEDNIKEFGKIDGDAKVTYVIKNDKLIINQNKK